MKERIVCPDCGYIVTEYEWYGCECLCLKCRKTRVDTNGELKEEKEYEIWSEGYSATGNEMGAQLLGKEKGRCFAEACHILMCKRYLKDHKDEPGRWDYDPSELTEWGCRLFGNEKDARKGFG